MFRSMMLVLVLGLLLVVPVGAQEIDPVCNADFMGDVTRIMEDAFNAAKTAIGEGNEAAWLDAVRDLRNGSAMVDALCSGFHFEGEGSEVLGPVVFPDGVYKVILAIDGGFGSMAFEKLDGDCDFVPGIIITDSAGGTQEDAYSFEACSTLIEMKTSVNWTLDFELIAAR
jgi:hypothetical protein